MEDLDGAQMCAEGMLRLRLPSRVSALLEAAFRAARASASRFLTPEECLLAIAVHFLAVWGPRKRRRVIDRDRGRCQVPGCSRPAVQSHHILFRSRGGGDEKENQTSMCLPHHLHCLHLGWLRVTGRAPGGLRWELGVRRGRPPLEVWAPGSAAT